MTGVPVVLSERKPRAIAQGEHFFLSKRLLNTHAGIVFHHRIGKERK